MNKAGSGPISLLRRPASRSPVLHGGRLRMTRNVSTYFERSKSVQNHASIFVMDTKIENALIIGNMNKMKNV
jgi:hypothetical protein